MKTLLTKEQIEIINKDISRNVIPSFLHRDALLKFSEVTVEKQYSKIHKDFLNKSNFIEVYIGKYGSTFVHQCCFIEYKSNHVLNIKHTPHIKTITKNILDNQILKKLVSFD
jgi:hypothetical protein